MSWCPSIAQMHLREGLLVKDRQSFLPNVLRVAALNAEQVGLPASSTLRCLCQRWALAVQLEAATAVHRQRER